MNIILGIGSDNGLAPTRRHSLIWNNDGIARFYSRATRRSVMVVAREKLAETDVRITDDLTPRDLEAKKRVIPFMNKLYSDKQKPRFANGRLYSNGKLVPQEAIDAFLSQLPA